MINEEDKYKNDLVSIIKRYDLNSNYLPQYWPEIRDFTKANIAENIDKNISADSIIAVFDTTLFRSCKNGIVFTVLGLYNIESFSSPEYANYSNIKSIELQEKKVNINLKDGRIITNNNYSIKNRVALCDLLKELVQYINDSLNKEEIKKDLVSIIKRYDLDSNHSPKYWPEISDSTKANIAKNIDKNISADSIIAVFDTTLFGNSCKNGIVFTVLGLYNIESFSRPEYANYSNIKSVELTEKKVNIHLKKGTIITNYNGTIKNRAALCDLLKELVHYNSIINESLNNDVHIILPDGTEEWFDTNGKTQDKTRKVSHWYDSMGNVIRALRPDGTDYNYRKDADGTEHWFDEKGEEFHRINSDGKELWFSKKSNSPIRTKEPDGVENWFDEQGINTYRKKPDGYEYWFDEQGEKSIRAKGPDGTEYWYDYDENKKLVHKSDSTGNEYWYDEEENEIHRKTSRGPEYWFEYGTNGKLIHANDSVGTEYWYDENENMTHQKDADGTEHWFENGQEIRRKNKFGTVYWFDGTSGKTIRAKYPDGSEEWYDSNGNIIRKRTSDGEEESYAYIESRPKSSSGEYDEQKAQDMAARYGRNATDADINNVKNNMGKMNKGPLAKIWDKVMTLWAGFNSPNTPASLKAMIIGGLIYMVSPVDLIPDFIPFLGLTDDAGVIGLVFSQFVRLTAGAAIVAGAAIKMYRIGVEEIKRKLNELNKKYSSFIVKNLKEGEDKYEVKVGLLDDYGNETEELTLEAPELAPDIRPGMTIHA